MAEQQTTIVPVERIERAIIVIRGEKVMFDADLALLYGVATGNLNRAVRRNASRFPVDFTFQLTAEEVEILKCQFGTSSSSWGGRRRSRPYAFTEQGIAMLSSVLHSPRAVAVNIEIMRAFVRLRQLLSTHTELARKLDELERKYDKQFAIVFQAIRKLMEPTPAAQRNEMGYHTLTQARDRKPNARRRR
jgi:hypothetical protein